MNDTITIEQLLKLCGYGTHINIKLADNGALAINGVNCIENSKDKRQKARMNETIDEVMKRWKSN